MSFDLTIKSDDAFSRTAEVARVSAFIAQLPDVRSYPRRGFVLDDRPARWMEIDLEFKGADGEYDPVLSATGPDTNCIRLHIPYACLGDLPHCDYFPTALAIARFLGWRLYDEQSGEDIREGDIPQREWAAFHNQVRQALGEG